MKQQTMMTTTTTKSRDSLIQTMKKQPQLPKRKEQNLKEHKHYRKENVLQHWQSRKGRLLGHSMSHQ
jgi:hypothetical protein